MHQRRLWSLLVAFVVCFPVTLVEAAPPPSKRKNANKSSRPSPSITTKGIQSGLAKKKGVVAQDINSALIRNEEEEDSLVTSLKTKATILKQARQESSLLRVEALLLPRRVSLSLVLRSVLGAVALLFFMSCLQTAGIPHMEAIWQLVHGPEEATGSRITMPLDYKPGALDMHLARLLAQATRETLPLIGMPSAGPLIGICLSLASLVLSTILLPRWFTSFYVALHYRRVPLLGEGIASTKKSNDSSSSSAKKEYAHALKTSSSATHVLVQIQDPVLRQQIAASASTTGSSSSSRSSTGIVCALHQIRSTKTPSKKNQRRKQRLTARGRVKLRDQYVHPYPHYIELKGCRYYVDIKTGACIEGGPHLLEQALLTELHALVQQGGLSKAQRSIAVERFAPYNTPQLQIPTIPQAVMSRLTSPLVLIQLIGGGLSTIEGGSMALFTLAMELLHHGQHAKDAVKARRQLSKEVLASTQDTNRMPIQLLMKRSTSSKKVNHVASESTATPFDEHDQWTDGVVSDLVPGDVFRIGMGNSSELTVPVDALLLDGQALVNEAILTGESVPQSKTSMDWESILDGGDQGPSVVHNATSPGTSDNKIKGEERLDQHEHHNSMLSAGTTMLHASSMRASLSNSSATTDSSIVCLALKTGSYSSKGKLLTSLRGKVGAITSAQVEKDAVKLTACLSCFAAASCFSLFLPTALSRSEHALYISPFRRVVQCSRIIIASLPSNLPMALSDVARFCAHRLRHDADVVCSSPEALLAAGHVDTVVFDKTGTLTADTQSLTTIVSELPHWNTSSADVTIDHKCLLAGCHSLVHLSPKNGSDAPSDATATIGDPLELAALAYSGWKYNSTEDYYYVTAAPDEKEEAPRPVRLWQLKAFPFDPTRRLSSAVALVEISDGRLELWSFAKGAAEQMLDLYSERDQPKFVIAFKKIVRKQELHGSRTIALGTMNLTDSNISQSFFEDGLTKSPHGIRAARRSAAHLSRRDLETPCLSSYEWEFSGISCFDAHVRSSSQRVVMELQDAGLNTMMLTGDSMDAAIATGLKVGILTGKKVAVLTTRVGSDGENGFVWTVSQITKKRSKRGARIATNLDTETINFNKASTQTMISEHKKNRICIAAAGEAIEHLVISTNDEGASRCLRENLFRISIIARAAPKVKEATVQALQESSSCNVLMCGDGVNDVAAMQAANVAVALMNGFGDEDNIPQDVDHDENERRKRIRKLVIGSNREKSRLRTEVNAMKTELEKVVVNARQKARLRTNSTHPNTTRQMFAELKEVYSAMADAKRKETKRRRALRKGGSEAARILSKARSSGNSTTGVLEESNRIQSGETSLIAPFSCLHPSIDGVSAILRTGVTASSFALSVQEKTALNALMQCYHLATLYRDGFRYSKKMWTVDSFFFTFAGISHYNAACIPRPYLPVSQLVRPAISMFQLSSIGNTLTQAALHILSMGTAVHFARQSEVSSDTSSGMSLKMAPSWVGSSSLRRLTKMWEAETKSAGAYSGRSPFRPNFETNVVFLLSILQSAIICYVHHDGRPFALDILESRGLCYIMAAGAALVVLCVGQMSPFISSQLGMRNWTERKDVRLLVGIMALNSVLSLVMKRFWQSHVSRPRVIQASNSSTHMSAAEEEETLWSEEYFSNHAVLRQVGSLLLLLLVRSLMKGNGA